MCLKISSDLKQKETLFQRKIKEQAVAELGQAKAQLG